MTYLEVDIDRAEPAASAQTRQRARLFVALYGVALVALLLLGAYVAPASAAGDAAYAPNGGAVEPSGPPAFVR